MDGPPAVTDTSNDVERAYREQHDVLWRALLLFAGDREVASDAVAEAFAQALHRGAEIRDVDRWVWRAGFKIALGELKRRGRVHQLDDLPIEMPEPTADLTRALAQLSEKQRACVVLHHYVGYSTKETAQIVGSTSSAVGVHLSRARARLRDLLKEQDDA
jgi:RNA polymerase sigma factor (sigma-70 family)